MKTTFKVMVLIFGLGAGILLMFHLVMLYGLTQTMREVVLPRVKQETGIDIQVGRLSINVVEGKLFLNRLEVRNPEGFFLENMASVDRVEIEIDIPSLFKKDPYLVRNVEVEHALLNVIRNKDGEFNIDQLQKKAAPPSQPPVEPEPRQPRPKPEKKPAPEAPAPEEPWLEVVVEKLLCVLNVRYIDFKLDQLDLMLQLKVEGENISTLRNPDAEWGRIAVLGALGDDHTSFITDLDLLLAPVTNQDEPSFDLAGKILEIDPRLMGDVYDSLNVRSDPFGIDPELHCRFGRFQQSQLGINIHNIQFEDKLAKDLGGIGTIGSLRIIVPVEGTLHKPRADFEGAFKAAIGNNAGSILEAFLKGAAAKAGMQEPPESMSDAAVEVLGQEIEEIGENEAAMEVLKDLADGEPSATNAPAPISSDTIVDILGEEIEEIGENEELKDELKNLGKWLFGQ